MALSNAEKQARHRQRQKERFAEYEAENLRLKKKVNRLLKELRKLQKQNNE